MDINELKQLIADRAELNAKIKVWEELALQKNPLNKYRESIRDIVFDIPKSTVTIYIEEYYGDSSDYYTRTLTFDELLMSKEEYKKHLKEQDRLAKELNKEKKRIEKAERDKAAKEYERKEFERLKKKFGK